MTSGHGVLDAKIFLIADGCTDDDISSGKCLTGTNASRINVLMKHNGLNIDQTYRTALIKDRINLIDPMKNKDLLTDDYKRILTDEIKTISPNIIVPLSELSFNYCTGLSGIRKFRGSILPARPDIVKQHTRVIPILGPNPYLNEEYRLNFISRLDFGKVAANQDREGPIEEEGITWIARTGEQLRNYFERQYAASSYVVFDIETFCGIPTCISFCFDGRESVTAPLLDYTISLDNRILMIEQIARLLNSPLGKVNQNVKFDWKKLEKFYFKVNNVVGDTLIATSCLFPEFPKNLGFLTSIYTDMPYFKDEGKQFDPTIHNRDRLYLYCAKDSLATHRIYSTQLEEMKETGVDWVYGKLIEVLPLYKKMEERGVRIDDERRKNLITKYESKYNIQLFKLKALIGQSINPLSNDQVRDLVFGELGYKVVRGVKTTKVHKLPGTDEESLEILIWNGRPGTFSGPQILKTIIACKKIHKVIEYLHTATHLDNRMRGEWNLGGTDNGRTSGGTTTDVYFKANKKHTGIEYDDLGHSFQNVGKHGFEVDGEFLGKDIRSMYVPSRGYSFVECDLSQAEARVDMVLAKDYDMLPIFDNGVGIHRLTGSWIYNCEPEEIRKGTLVDGVDRYYQAKTARHAGERNMREDRLMMMIHQPILECARILRTFHQKQPNIREVFHREIAETIKNSLLLVAPNGRRRQFFGDPRKVNDMVNEAISFIPQAVVSDQMKFSFIPTFKECDWAFPLIEQHDGCLSEVPLGRELEFTEVFKKNVETPIDFRTCSLSRGYLLTIPMEAEMSTESWAGMKELQLV